ncbi:MFS transporter [Clostridium perfringens]|jgi:NNP family nitrate/nitrite transporter-like MFS transporter|uniref:MFS transporter n=2 Tax=Clostridium perfringens TaxID=1502 RepID=A0A6G4ZD63_CLOPF|nr:MFS transporter [Clostridium perfringens]AQW27883.1 MFS transporter [Clostridium perfringens]EDT15908.1 major facilitator family transporter [Clostridium perfringens E str. JGS1987]EHK2388704.1 MFS transporter [Clostridium perfringens]EHK2403589.1 MFS transporter [Clostridium perfringens]EIF6290290.1 MFS transporter [Clostridium perfringens]
MKNLNLKGNPNRGLIGATLGFFIGFAAVSLYGPTSAVFKEAFVNLNPVLLALLIAAPNLSGSLLRIPFSAWVDTTGGRKPLIVLLLLSIIGMGGLYVVLAFFSDNLNQYYYLLFALGLLSGCGIATFSVGVSQASYWFPKSKQGVALGIYGGVGNLAPGIFALLIPNLALPLLGLPGSYLAWLIFLIVGTVIYIKIGQNAWYFQLVDKGINKDEAKEIASKEYGQELFPKGKASETLLISAKSWKTWALVFIYFTTFGGFLALTGWFPNYWMTYFGLNMKVAGLLTALYSILTSLTRIYGGKVADKNGGEITTIVSLGIALIGAICMTFASTMTLAIIGIILLAIGMGVANAAVFKIVPNAVPEAMGGASGWIGGLGALGGFLIPPVMASFLNRSGFAGYSQGFSVFIVLIIVAIGVIALFQALQKKSSK